MPQAPVPAGPVVASPYNPRLRAVRELLRSARARRERASSVLEGIHLVQAWIDHGSSVDELVLGEASLTLAPVQALLARGARSIRRVLLLDDRLFEQLGTMPSAAPVLAVVTTPSPTLPTRLDGDALLLDRVQDPGNVGAIIRSAAAAGVGHLLTTPQTAWCWSPKVLRAAMGGHFALSIHESVPWDAVRALANASGLPLAATVLRDGRPIHDADLRPRCLWVFGNEGAGVDPTMLATRDWRLTIEHGTGVESLNVAAAAAICLFEQRRQRRHTDPRLPTQA
ncbi:MAG: TrmH family RNA methyltransferase [Lautropia sp.]